MYDKPELLRLAKFLTGSSNIDELIETAKKLDKFANASEIATTYQHPLLQTPQTDIVSFAATLAIQHPTRGAVPFVLYDYQRAALQKLTAAEGICKTVAIASGRQMGWSTLLSAYMLHYALNNDDKTVLVMAPRHALALDVADRVKFMVSCRPDVTVKTWNKSEVEFANGSRILFRAAGVDSARGMTLNKVIIIDAAYVSHKRLDELVTAIAPALAHGAQMIMQSTPTMANDPFHEFFKTAHLALHQPWTMHPERDQSWADFYKQQIGDDKFETEFEAKFK